MTWLQITLIVLHLQAPSHIITGAIRPDIIESSHALRIVLAFNTAVVGVSGARDEEVIAIRNAQDVALRRVGAEEVFGAGGAGRIEGGGMGHR